MSTEGQKKTVEGSKTQGEGSNERLMMVVEQDDTNTNHTMYVNADDGLLEAIDEENNTARQLERERLQLPTNLIVTGFQPEFFEDTPLRQRLEGLFKLYGDATFRYFKSFKRVRVTYSSGASATQARIKMHMSSLGDNVLKCYFGQTIMKRKDSDGFLHPPTPDKQFLISPPASPPVGWEPIPESRPAINYDLVSAITKLKPGEAHELHKPEKESQPSIVVHVVGDEEVEEILDETGGGMRQKMKIMRTRRPEI